MGNKMKKKNHNRAEIWWISSSQFLEGVPLLQEILQDFDTIVHNNIKSTLQLQAKTLTETACIQQKYINKPIKYNHAEKHNLIILEPFLPLAV